MTAATATAPPRRAAPSSPALPVPGPRLPMIAQTALSAPWLGQRFLHRCTRRYGRTFRLHIYFAGELIVTSDLELIRELFITRKDGEPLATWVPDGSIRRMVGDNPLTSTDGEAHKLNRRRLSEPLRLLVHPEGNRLSDDVRAAFERLPAGGPHSLWSVIEPVLFEGVLRDALGVTDPARRAGLRAAFATYHQLGHRPELFDASLQRLIGRRLLPRFDEAEQTIRSLVDEELASGARDGVRAGLLAFARAWARDIGVDERSMCVEMVKGIVYASIKTTTSACTWTLLLLLHHPEVLQRVRRGLAEGDTDLLVASVREALRLFPPHPLTPLRRLNETIEWGSLALPRDSVLGVAASVVHRDPSIYTHPNRFEPDRFEGGWSPPPFGWLPFGAGLRRCLGQHWALARAHDVVRTVVEHTRLAPARPRLEPVWFIQQAHGPRHGGEVIKL